MGSRLAPPGLPCPDHRGTLTQMPIPRIRLLSIFPAACRAWMEESIVGRARRRGLVDADVVDPRAWAGGRHRKVDDRPFGGGPGMVLMAPPLAGALDHLQAGLPRARLLITSPQGRRLDQAWARELAGQDLIIICGHYEGVDERIVDIYRPEPFSIGDYVLSGGELPALVLVDALVRLLPGALGDARSAEQESFAPDGSMDHPCYTRPREFRELAVPEALVSGDHAAIEAWRAQRRRERSGG